jgi:hypothetical protein
LCTLAARLALDGRDERERARRGRAVVVRDPEGELDERLRELLDDALDRRDGDPIRRLDAELDDEPAPLRVAEANLDDGADASVIGYLVGEGPRESARGDERIDGGERDPSRLLGGGERIVTAQQLGRGNACQLS